MVVNRSPLPRWSSLYLSAYRQAPAFLLHFNIANARQTALNDMTDVMEVDSPDQRGTKRAGEDSETSGPAQPKRIKVHGDSPIYPHLLWLHTQASFLC